MKKLIALLLCLLLCASALPSLAAVYTESDGLPFIIRNGSREEHRVAVTVDDCYNIDAVRQLYELFAEFGVKATFFPLGCNLKESDGELWRAIIDAGHEIGTHTYYHNSMTEMTGRAIIQSLGRCQEALDRVLGYHYQITALRPPYGNARKESGPATVRDAVQKFGLMHVVNWDVSQTDPDIAINQVQNGVIMLYHSNPKDINCLRKLIPQILERGYEFVTVSEMFGWERETVSDELYVFNLADYQ